MGTVPSGLTDPGASDPGSTDPGATVADDMSPADVATGASFAMQVGHSWAEISDHLGTTNTDEAVQRQSLVNIWGQDVNTPGRDAINSGAGPIGEAVLAGAAGSVVGIARGVGTAIADGLLSDITGAQANPIRSLVATSTAEARVPFLTNTDKAAAVDTLQRMGKYGSGILAGSYVMQYGLGVGKKKMGD